MFAYSLFVQHKNEEDIVSRGFERAELQLSAQLKVVPEPNEYPRTIKAGN